MTPQQHQRVKQLFGAAVKLARDERRRFIERECSGDPAVREELEALLSHDESSVSTLRTPVLGGAFTRHLGRILASAEKETPPPQIGPYRVIRQIGEGGMGVVYQAEQDRPRRTVALKVIRRGLSTPALMKRFELEAELLGRLQHPGIARIYEAGLADLSPFGGHSQHPFLAMEFVPGASLVDYAQSKELQTPERLRLMVKVCQAVQHAHLRGVIHRDLKPANILVDDSTGDPQPKVLDFGVARATDVDVRLTTVETNVGQLVGTLPYMSPEQVGGDPGQIDSRSDVYALGVILFQLLTGKLPHSVDGRPLPEAARVIREDPPSRLSSFSKVFRGDIETIVLRAMDKDRRRRYQSAAELGADIERYLAGEPILARQDSAMYVLRKQLKRYRNIGLAAMAVMTALLAFAAYASWQATVQSRMAAQERIAKIDAESQRRIASSRADELERSLYYSAIGHAYASHLGGDTDRSRELLASIPGPARGWEWHHLDRLRDESAAVYRSLHGEPHAFGDRGRLLAHAFGGDALVMDTRTGAAILERRDARPLTGMAAQPAGRTVAIGRPGLIELVDVDGGATRTLEVDAASAPKAFSTDGAALVLHTRSGAETLTLVRIADGSRAWSTTVKGFPSTIVFSPDGRLAAVGLSTGAVALLDAASGRPVATLEGHTADIRGLAFSPDGSRIASASNDTTVRLWRTPAPDADGAPAPASAIVRGFANKAVAVAWTPDGTHLVVGGTDPGIRVVDVATEAFVRTLHGHGTRVSGLVFDPDTGNLVSSSLDGTCRLWSRITEPRDPLTTLERAITVGDVNPSTGALVVGDMGGRLLRLHPHTLEVEARADVSRIFFNRVRFAADGKALAAAAEDGVVRILDPLTLTERASFVAGVSKRRAVDAAIDPSGRRVAVVTEDLAVTLWDAATGKPLGAMPEESVAPTRVLWSADGSRLYIGAHDGVIRERSADTGELKAQYRGLQAYVTMIAEPPGGESVIGADDWGSMYVWRRGSPEPEHALRGHQGYIYAASVSPDGSRLATGGWDNTVRLWDWRSGRLLLTLRGHLMSVGAACFSPDGSRILSASGDRTARAWVGKTGEPAGRDP